MASECKYLSCLLFELLGCPFVEVFIRGAAVLFRCAAGLSSCDFSFIELIRRAAVECSFVELKGCSSAELLECSSVKLPECSFVELLTVVPGQLSFCIASEVNRFDEATFFDITHLQEGFDNWQGLPS